VTSPRLLKTSQTAFADVVRRCLQPERSSPTHEREAVLADDHDPVAGTNIIELQDERWFRNGQKWRTGSEGRISVVKRRHGLDRSRYRGQVGIKRWVGLGVIADNLVNISRAMARQSSP
jgi:Transposase DDE domain